MIPAGRRGVADRGGDRMSPVEHRPSAEARKT